MKRLAGKALGDMVDRASEISAAGFVPVTEDDRFEFGTSLILHGWSPRLAFAKACQLEDSDGALQMLARCRIAHTKGPL